MGLGDRLDDFNTLVRLRTSVGLEQWVPQEWARNVRVPTFLYQVRGDILTHPGDVQAMFDNIPVVEKKRGHDGPLGRLLGSASRVAVATLRSGQGFRAFARTDRGTSSLAAAPSACGRRVRTA
jgi:hypothetical protein